MPIEWPWNGVTILKFSSFYINLFNEFFNTSTLLKHCNVIIIWYDVIVVLIASFISERQLSMQTESRALRYLFLYRPINYSKLFAYFLGLFNFTINAFYLIELCIVFDKGYFVLFYFWRKYHLCQIALFNEKNCGEFPIFWWNVVLNVRISYVKRKYEKFESKCLKIVDKS